MIQAMLCLKMVKVARLTATGMNAQGRLYGSGERVGLLADMDARPWTLRFFREGALLDGVVCSGFPEQVRICASPYNMGVTATLSFPARPE